MVSFDFFRDLFKHRQGQYLLPVHTWAVAVGGRDVWVKMLRVAERGDEVTRSLAGQQVLES